MAKSGALRLRSFLPYRLSIASNMVSDLIAGSYRSLFHLSIPEWRLIAVLGERGRLTQFDIAAATRMDKVTVSRGSVSLAGRGLVERKPNPQDGRSQILSLTPDGERLYRQVVPKALDLEAQLLADFAPEEIEILNDMLARLEAAAARLAHPEGAGPTATGCWPE